MTESLYDGAFDTLRLTETTIPETDKDGEVFGEGLFDLPEPENDVHYDEPEADFLNKPRKPRGAAQYEKKVSTILNAGIRFTIAREETLPDAAALLMYGPELSRQTGLLAAHDARVARMLDWMDEGVSNPYLAVIMAAAPLVTQLIRNHEPVLEPKARTFTLPFGKKKRSFKLPFRLGIKLGLIRNATHEPNAFTDSVINHHAVRAKLKTLGINVATPNQ